MDDPTLLDDLESDLEDDLLDALDDNAGDDAAEEVLDMMKFHSVQEVTKTLESEKLHEHLEKIEEAGETPKPGALSIGSAEYQLVIDSNQWVNTLNKDIAKVHKFIRDHYAARFPELDGFVFEPVAYAKVVQLIGNKKELKNEQKELAALVANHTAMSILMALSTTSGRQLAPHELETVNAACDEIRGLEEAKQVMLEFVETRMSKLAPNMSAIVGTAIAARLLGAAGGLQALTKLNSNVIRVLGKSRKDTGGFAAGNTVFHAGFILNCDIVANEMDKDKRKTAALVANKLTLAIRADATGGGTSDGAYGRKLREDIVGKIAKWKEPNQQRTIKALPAPKESRKTKRAGAKAQRMKAKWKTTEVGKQMNRMDFGVIQEDTYGGDGSDDEGFGNLKNAGKMRLQAETFVRPTKRMKLDQTRRSKEAQRSGLATSLAFTPVQGMELGSMDFASKSDDADNKFFGTATPFMADTRSAGGGASMFSEASSAWPKAK